MVTLSGYSVPPIVDDPTCETPASPSPNSLRYLVLSGGGGGGADSLVEDSDGAEVVGSLDEGGSEVDGDVGGTDDPVLFVAPGWPDWPVARNTRGTPATTTAVNMPPMTAMTMPTMKPLRAVIRGYPYLPLAPLGGKLSMKALQDDPQGRALAVEVPPRVPTVASQTQPTLAQAGRLWPQELGLEEGVRVRVATGSACQRMGSARGRGLWRGLDLAAGLWHGLGLDDRLW
jgi:hypothetical protein